MEKRFQSILSRVSRLMELFLAGCIIAMILVLIIIAVKDYILKWESLFSGSILENFLRSILSFAIGIEFVKMLIQHRPEYVMDVLIFATSRQMIVEHTDVKDTFIRILAIGLLFGIQKYFITPAWIPDKEETAGIPGHGE